MCNLFLSQDPATHTPETRAIACTATALPSAATPHSGPAGYDPCSARAQHAKA
ncbi:MAG TPA: hypothetical protein VE690_18660 [Rhodopila sp.]|nr:hypothetical protein [Rhodopila sp.]